MALIAVNLAPSDRQLRQFSVALAIAPAIVMWMWGIDLSWIAWVTLTSTAIACITWLWPRTVWPIYIAMTVVALPIGMVLGEIALLVIYWLVVVPIGLWLRVRKKDILDLKVASSEKTYWREKSAPNASASYYRQF